MDKQGSEEQGSEERKVKSEEFNSFILEITNKKRNNNEDIL
ncbi:hypothetical protein V7T06_14980 [Segatella copri]|nr:hypothetical protein [Segatella copri]